MSTVTIEIHLIDGGDLTIAEFDAESAMELAEAFALGEPVLTLATDRGTEHIRSAAIVRIIVGEGQ